MLIECTAMLKPAIMSLNTCNCVVFSNTVVNLHGLKWLHED